MEPGPPTIAPTSIAPTSNELRIASADTGPRDPQTPVRIDVRRLVQLVFYALILPGGSAIAFDFWLGLFPLLTLGTMVVVFPIAAFIILRSTVREMKNVIDQVAPEETAPEETTPQANHEISAKISAKISSEFDVAAERNSTA